MLFFGEEERRGAALTLTGSRLIRQQALSRAQSLLSLLSQTGLLKASICQVMLAPRLDAITFHRLSEAVVQPRSGPLSEFSTNLTILI